MTFNPKRDGPLLRQLYAPDVNDQVAAKQRRLGELRRQLAEQQRQRDLAAQNITVLTQTIAEMEGDM